MPNVNYRNEAVTGIIKGVTEEIEKLVMNGVNSNIPWSQILRTKKVLLPTLSIKSVPAISPIVGKRTIHIELDVELDEKADVVAYQAHAFQLVVPPPLNQALGCFALSMAIEAIWIQMWKKRTTVKPPDEKATGLLGKLVWVYDPYVRY